MSLSYIWVFVSLVVTAAPYPQTTGRDGDVHRYSAVTNELGYRLQRIQSHRQGNQVISPYGISTVLGALYQGAKGIAKQQLGKIGYRALEEQDISQTHQKLRRYLQKSSGETQVEEVTIFLYPAESSLSHQYQQLLESTYQCLVQQVDYSRDSENSHQNINRWLREQTNGKISQVINRNDDIVSGFKLLNGVYFQGKPHSSSIEGEIQQRLFYNEGEITPRSVLSYQIQSRYPYYQDRQLQAVQIPMSGAEFSILVLLPRDHDGVRQLQQQVSYNTLQRIVTGFQDREVKVSIPHFTLDYSQHLEQDIRQLGITSIFEHEADISRFSKTGNFYVSQIVQRAVVKIGVHVEDQFHYQNQQQHRYVHGQERQYENEQGQYMDNIRYGSGHKLHHVGIEKHQLPTFLKNLYEGLHGYRNDIGQHYPYGNGQESYYHQKYEKNVPHQGSQHYQYGNDQDLYRYKQEYEHQGRQQYSKTSGDYESQSDIAEVRVNRPFLFYIVHNPTGLNLLSGRISEL